VTGLGTGNPRNSVSIPDRCDTYTEILFTKTSGLSFGSTQPPIRRDTGESSPWAMLPGRQPDHSHHLLPRLRVSGVVLAHYRNKRFMALGDFLPYLTSRLLISCLSVTVTASRCGWSLDG
jgi:hypothetical protein